MLRNLICKLKFGLECLMMLPYYVMTRVSFYRKHRKIAESMGLTFEEYKASLVISK